MKKLLALAALAALTIPALAADNTLLVTPCSAGCVTTKSKDVGSGVQAPQPILSDTNGNPMTFPTSGADGVSNTVTGVQNYGYPFWFNGTTWDRARGDSTNGAFVNVKTSVLPTGGSTSANQSTALTALGAPGDTACATDNGSCSLEALAKRTNQNLTTLNTTAGSAIASGSNRIGYVSDDPCTQLTKSSSPITQIISTKILPQSASNKNYICSIFVIAADAENISVVEGTGTLCGSSTAAVIGGTTAAAGMNLAANGGWTFGNGGATVAKRFTTNSDLCLLQSGTGRVSGSFTYIQTP